MGKRDWDDMHGLLKAAILHATRLKKKTPVSFSPASFYLPFL